MEVENQEKIFQPINIREVVKGKNPKLARRVPGFIYNWLERVFLSGCFLPVADDVWPTFCAEWHADIPVCLWFVIGRHGKQSRTP